MITVTGVGRVVAPDPPCDPRPYLKERKVRKYMGVQDDLAVVAAGRALERAGLEPDLGARAGLYVAVGYIPFRGEDVDPVLAASLEGGAFSMSRFAAEGYTKAHPLVTFRCLPNMPAFHVSACFGIEGPYLISYPSAGQLYAALEEACVALDDGRVDVAVVLGVACQRNFLVEHHFARGVPPVPADALADAGAALVLERPGRAPALATLASVELSYTPFDPRRRTPRYEEWATVDGQARDLASPELGPASLPAALADAVDAGARELGHRLSTRDGHRAASRWSIGGPA